MNDEEIVAAWEDETLPWVEIEERVKFRKMDLYMDRPRALHRPPPHGWGSRPWPTGYVSPMFTVKHDRVDPDFEKIPRRSPGPSCVCEDLSRTSKCEDHPEPKLLDVVRSKAGNYGVWPVQHNPAYGEPEGAQVVHPNVERTAEGYARVMRALGLLTELS